MKFSATQRAIELAQRFINIAERVERAKRYDGTPYGEGVDIGKNSAAARRASMDLTRQLAEMRKP